MKSKPAISSWEKWTLMSVIILGLSGVVIWFNLRVFGVEDGAPYIAVVGLVALASLLITRHVKRHPVVMAFVVGAFIFDILFTVCLTINAAYSLSIMREMSVAGVAERELAGNLETVGKLKSDRAQRAALSMLDRTAPTATRSSVFSAHEKNLRWIMIAELTLAGIAIFTLIGLSIFDKDGNGIPDALESPTLSVPSVAGLGDRGFSHTATASAARGRGQVYTAEGPVRPQ